MTDSSSSVQHLCSYSTQVWPTARHTQIKICKQNSDLKNDNNRWQRWNYTRGECTCTQLLCKRCALQTQCESSALVCNAVIPQKLPWRVTLGVLGRWETPLSTGISWSDEAPQLPAQHTTKTRPLTSAPYINNNKNQHCQSVAEQLLNIRDGYTGSYFTVHHAIS